MICKEIYKVTNRIARKEFHKNWLGYRFHRRDITSCQSSYLIRSELGMLSLAPAAPLVPDKCALKRGRKGASLSSDIIFLALESKASSILVSRRVEFKEK